MRHIKLSLLASTLGIPARTMRHWVSLDPALAIRKEGVYWIDLERLAARGGLSLVDAYLLGSKRWVQATLLADLGKIPRRTVAGWCKSRNRFAVRLGATWYVDLEGLGVDIDDIDALVGPVKTPGRVGHPTSPALELVPGDRGILELDTSHRGRALIMLADGVSAKHVGKRLGLHTRTITSWRLAYIRNSGKASQEGETELCRG